MDQNSVVPQKDIPEIPSDWAYPKAYQKTITFNDETVLIGTIQRSNISSNLWIFPSDPNFGYLELIQVFADPEKTSVMICNRSETEQDRYEGYTRLASITAETDGTFSVCMTKPIE